MRMGWPLYLSLICFALAFAALEASAQHPMVETNRTYICNSGGPCPINMLAKEYSSNDGNVDVNIHSWQGVATINAESYPIRVNIESFRPIDPAEARKFLESNASLGEIRSSLKAEEKAPTRAGNMKLNNDIYRLINITVEDSGNNSVLQANVAGPIAGPRSGLNKSNTKVGNIIIKTSLFDDTESAEGTLVMNDPNYSGTYGLLLESRFPGRGPRVGLITKG